MALAGGGTSSMGWENNFSPIQFETLKSILIKLKDKYNIQKIIGHSEVDSSKEGPSFDVQGWLEKNGLV